MRRIGLALRVLLPSLVAACAGQPPAEPYLCERDVDCAVEQGWRCDLRGGPGRCVKGGSSGGGAVRDGGAVDGGAVDAGAPDEDAGGCGWWRCGYRQRVQLRFENTGRGPLEGFPVLVVLAPQRFPYADARPDGSDLRFVDADDRTPLPHEVERWSAGGTSYLWVRVPRIDGASSDDFIWLYFDLAPGAAEPPAAGGPVWDDDFLGVWHLSGGAEDSTARGLHGARGGSADADGRVGGAQDLDAVAGDPIQVPGGPALDELTTAFTVSAWALRQSADTGWRALVARPLAGDIGNHFYLGFFDGAFQLHVGTPGVASQALGGQAALDRWYHVAGTWDGVATSVYVDGALVAADPGPAGPLALDDMPLWLGGDSNDGNATNTDFFDGLLDEVRLSRVRRSIDWLRAEHAAGTDGLLRYGAPERR